MLLTMEPEELLTYSLEYLLTPCDLSMSFIRRHHSGACLPLWWSVDLLRHCWRNGVLSLQLSSG